jgi:hypothetical protein
MFKRIQNWAFGIAVAVTALAICGDLLSRAIVESPALTRAAMAATTIIENGTTWFQHANVAQRVPPTISAGTMTVGSTDYIGQFTSANSGTHTITFNLPFTNAPICRVSSEAFDSTGPIYSSTKTTLVISAVPAIVKVDYMCVGAPS